MIGTGSMIRGCTPLLLVAVLGATSSVVLAKDSPLTTCINKAIQALIDDGTQQKLVDQWLPYKDTPEIKP